MVWSLYTENYPMIIFLHTALSTTQLCLIEIWSLAASGAGAIEDIETSLLCTLLSQIVSHKYQTLYNLLPGCWEYLVRP